MTLAEPRAAAVDLPSRGLVKMDDRKRPATYDTDDAGPPSKRQATAANGGKALHRDDGMPFKEDLEVCGIEPLVPLRRLRTNNESNQVLGQICRR
jgi:hypothetical protein